ncbi:MAG: hypothetical protein EOP93_06650 [Lysobacteraceae bacterium]|nr:MAG: hypothetical protein EOP93_06650 [Xanthomonadaceae bacterium]
MLASTTAWAATTVTQDGGFEAGVPNASWIESSSNFGTVLCTVGSCGLGGGTGPRTGSWWAWFGGTAALEVGRAYQDVLVAPGTATLTFWLQIPVTAGNGADFLKVSMDNTELFRATGNATAAYTSYTQVTIDVSAFADGGTHTLKFDSTTNGGTTNFFVDDITLDVEENTTTCASEGYTGTQLTWCRNICEMGYTGSTLNTWIRRWTDRYRQLPYCAVAPQPAPAAR